MTNKSLEKFISLAAAMPAGMCLQELDQAVQRYKQSHAPEDREKLAMACQLFCTKIAIDEEGLVKVLQDTNSLQSVHQKIINSASN